MKKSTKKLGELLLDAGLIDEFQLRSALSYQGEWGGRIGSIMIKRGFVSEKDMLSVIEKQFGLPAVSLEAMERPSNEVMTTVGVETAKKFGIFPLRLEGKTLEVAMADPTDLKTIDDLSFMLGVRVKPLLALESDITRAIGIHYEGRPPREGVKISKEILAGVNRETVFNGNIASVPPVQEQAAPKQRPEISQKVVLEGLIDLLVSKGLITKDELIGRIRSRGKT